MMKKKQKNSIKNLNKLKKLIEIDLDMNLYQNDD